MTGGGGSLEGLAATLMQVVRSGGLGGTAAAPATPATATEVLVAEDAPEVPAQV